MPTFSRTIKCAANQFRQRFKSGEVVSIVLSSAPPGVFDMAGEFGHITWDISGDFVAQVKSVVDLLLRKHSDVRAKKKIAAEEAALKQTDAEGSQLE